MNMGLQTCQFFQRNGVVLISCEFAKRHICKVRLLKIPLEGFIHKKGVSLAAVIYIYLVSPTSGLMQILHFDWLRF